MEKIGVALVAENSAAYFATLDKVNDTNAAVGRSAQQAAGGLNTMQESLIGGLRRVGELAVNALGQAAQAVGQFVGDAVGKAGDFEASMLEFGAVTGGAIDESGKSLEDFKDLFISLGRDLPVSTAEVQQAAIEMAKGGIDPATIAAGGLKTALDLAAAGGVGIADAAEIMSKQLGVWVDRSADAAEKTAFLTQTANLLTQAANASSVDVRGLSMGLAQAGGVAKLAGLSFEETVTSVALLAPGFFSASDAGTGFKTFLTALIPQTDTAAEKMKELGLLTAEGTSKFYDASGSFIGMEASAQLLQGALEGMGEAQRTAALKTIFGTDAIRVAGILADQGAAGYRAMAEEMAKVGSAAQQAARRQQGWNVATDNLMGSIEALQITLGSALLPSLTAVVNLFAKGINVVTDYVDATAKGETVLSAVGSILQASVIPALVGATAAMIAYAIANASTGALAVGAFIEKVVASTTALVANAGAALAAAGPYIAIAAAVGGVVMAYNDFENKIQDATQELLNSRTWWTDSTDAIERYSLATGEAKTALAPFAASVQVLRDQIEEETASLGRRMAAGLVSEQQYQTEIATINRHSEQLKIVTGAYNEAEQAQLKLTAGSTTATTKLAELQSGTGLLSGQISLTAKDVEELGKKIEAAYAKGQEAVMAYAASSSEYLSGMEARQLAHKDTIAALEAEKQTATTEEQRRGIDERIAAEQAGYASQEQEQAGAYARQQQAQLAHLGQMLIDYTVSQAMLGNITKEKAAEITAALETEYGLQESSTATTFLNMAGSVDKYANDAGGSIGDLIGDLRDNQAAARDTQKAMDDYAKEYVATQVNNFLDGKMDADALRGSLEKMPRRIDISVVTTYSERGTQRQGGGVDFGSGNEGPSGRAVGGFVAAGTPYEVGERGRELFIPETNGTILPHEQTRRAEASLAQMLSQVAPAAQPAAGPSITYQMPIYTNQTPAVLQQSLALIEAMV